LTTTAENATDVEAGSGSRTGPSLVLASGSPRRRELLEQLAVEFIIRVADIDETPISGEQPEVYVRRLAEGKARAASAAGDSTTGEPGEVILAADTIVALDGQLLGKPRDAADARRMLRDLSAREHDVLTGVAVLESSGTLHAEVESTRVRFGTLSEAEVSWYAASGEPLDKAGAYAIQGLGALFVETVTGNYSNVVGLPLPLVYRLLKQAGFSLIKLRT